MSELIDPFEVSRPTLREAFRILETESLIVLRRESRGAKVISPSVRVAARHFAELLQFAQVSIADVYQARTIIEPKAAGIPARVLSH